MNIQKISMKEKSLIPPKVELGTKSSIYALDISHNSHYGNRIAFGTMLECTDFNYVQLNQLNENGGFEDVISFQHRFSPTTLQFIPSKNPPADLIATASDRLYIWKIHGKQPVQLCSQLQVRQNISKYCDVNPPVTSFDWNSVDQSLIAAGSIDKKVTLWSINKQRVVNQIQCFGEVLDLQFGKYKDIIAICMANGTAKLRDLRQFRCSSLYSATSPLLSLSWNKGQCPHLMGVVEKDQNYVTMLDIRKPNKILARLLQHKNLVNGFQWGLGEECYACSISDDKFAYIWSLNREGIDQYRTPVFAYKGSCAISNVRWSPLNPQMVVLGFLNRVQVLKF